jgi:TetR/AcrR family transcriptional regulator, cholesterol catabolism regulator
MTAETEVRHSPRSKRTLILSVAIDQFGTVGYERTKWASIADEVGIGQTALYHYFESKAHCLLTIMRLELADSAERFAVATAGISDPAEALQTAVAAALEATPTDASRRRILLNHMDLLATERHSVKEEEERLRSRELVSEIERSWTDMIARGIESGDFVDSDPHLLGRLVLSLIVSVWRWYRPGGKITLEEITGLITDAAWRIVRT